jgi:hypothetical protein
MTREVHETENPMAGGVPKNAPCSPHVARPRPPHKRKRRPWQLSGAHPQHSFQIRPQFKPGRYISRMQISRQPERVLPP